MTVASRCWKETVILWGEEFCSWIGVLDKLGLRPAAVILHLLDAVKLAKGAIGIDCFVGVASDLVKILLPWLRGKCRLGLVDGRITGSLWTLVTQLDLSCLIGTTCVGNK
jgi:hypothetical protein